MPELTGEEATRRIRVLEGGREVVIVALSASVSESDREGLLAAGCDAFVRKPYREGAIFEVMAQYLGVAYVYAEAEGPAALPTLTREALSGMPEAWLTTVHHFKDLFSSDRHHDESAHVLVPRPSSVLRLCRAVEDLLTHR